MAHNIRGANEVMQIEEPELIIADYLSDILLFCDSNEEAKSYRIMLVFHKGSFKTLLWWIIMYSGALTQGLSTGATTYF